MTEPKDTEDFVTIARFNEPIEAQMAQGALHSADIECFIVGENANSLIALAFRAALQVSRANESAAKAILNSIAPAGTSTAAELEDEATRNK